MLVGCRLNYSVCGVYILICMCICVYKGLNSRIGFDTAFAAEIARLTGLPFVTAPNKVRRKNYGCIAVCYLLASIFSVVYMMRSSHYSLCVSFLFYVLFSFSSKRLLPMMRLLRRTVP